jgi:hypothetical protein
MSYELWIGARYAGLARSRRRAAGRRDRFVSFIAASSMAGIALGVAALIVVLSVMNGFQTQVRDKMLSVLPHIELFVPRMQGDLTSQWRDIADQAQRNPSVSGVAPFVAAQGMLVRGEALSGVQVRGIDARYESTVSDLAGQMLVGSLDALQPGKFGIVLGNQLASILNVDVGQTVMVLAPQGSISPAGFAPRMRQFTVTGVFSSGYYEYDASLAFINVEDAARVFRDSGAGGVRLRIADMHKAPQVARELARDLPPYVIAQDWTLNNRTWFAAVQTDRGGSGVQPAVVAGDGGQGQAFGYRHLAHLGFHSARNRANFPGPGSIDRLRGHGAGRRTRRLGRLQYRRDRPVHRAHAGSAVFAATDLFHYGNAVQSATERYRRDRSDVADPVLVGDFVSQLARIASAAGRGIAP